MLGFFLNWLFLIWFDTVVLVFVLIRVVSSPLGEVLDFELPNSSVGIIAQMLRTFWILSEGCFQRGFLLGCGRIFLWEDLLYSDQSWLVQFLTNRRFVNSRVSCIVVHLYAAVLDCDDVFEVNACHISFVKKSNFAKLV